MPEGTQCSRESCPDTAYARGLCRKHYFQWWHARKKGKTTEEPAKLEYERICSVETCTKERRTKGLCLTHASRLRRGFPLDAPIGKFERQPEVCSVETCDRKARTKGLCQSHSTRAKRGRPLDSPFVLRREDCSVHGCDQPHSGKGLCQFHYVRHRNGTPLDRPRASGRSRDGRGYVRLLVGEDYPGASRGGYMAEHRYVMEQIIGRSLLPGENVHHKNGVRDDNRPENLELWVRSQPSGQRAIDLVDYALEILERYGDLAGIMRSDRSAA